MAGLYSSSDIGVGSGILQYMAGLRIQKVLNIDQKFEYDSINIFKSLSGLERNVEMNLKGFLAENVLRVKKLRIVRM